MCDFLFTISVQQKNINPNSNNCHKQRTTELKDKNAKSKRMKFA